MNDMVSCNKKCWQARTMVKRMEGPGDKSVNWVLACMRYAED